MLQQMRDVKISMEELEANMNIGLKFMTVTDVIVVVQPKESHIIRAVVYALCCRVGIGSKYAVFVMNEYRTE